MAAEPLLDPALLARLERVQLVTGRRLVGRFSGEHRSSRHGSSLDFADYRDYHPGDDFRRIDYSLYARTDQLFIRLFEAEDDLAVRLLVDTSASMGFDGKLRQAARLAAALGFVSLVRRDAVQLYSFPPGRADRFNGRSSLAALMHRLETMEPAGITDIDRAADALLARSGPPGMSIVISDLLTPTWPAAIERLPARGGEVTVVHVLSNAELDPELAGDLDLVDAESGDRLPVSLTHDVVADYRASVQAWLADIEARCAHRGVRYVRVEADDDIEEVLLRSWRRAGVVR
ncbi:MAG: DUF58 domain-containing protein [Ilumatobacteraceae bacterium]